MPDLKCVSCMFYIEWELEVRVGLQETNNLFFYFTNNVGVSKSWVTATDSLIDCTQVCKKNFELFFPKNMFHAYFILIGGFRKQTMFFRPYQ